MTIAVDMGRKATKTNKINTHTLCVQMLKALVRLRVCAGLSKSSMLTYTKLTQISRAGLSHLFSVPLLEVW